MTAYCSNALFAPALSLAVYIWHQHLIPDTGYVFIMPETTGPAYLRFPGAPPAGTPLCRLDALPESGARGFLFGEDVNRFDMFVVWRGGKLHAYVNDCPHAHTPLDYLPDRFFNLEKSHLLCGTHGALFRIQDGHCISGPCKGRSLTPVPVHLENDIICIG